VSNISILYYLRIPLLIPFFPELKSGILREEVELRELFSDSTHLESERHVCLTN
jgi:hypothetical protein